VNGTVSQAEISRAFHVPSKTVKRYVKRLREGSAKSFFETPRRRAASVLQGEVKMQAQTLLDEGESVPAVARKLGVLPNTLHKAIRAERLHQPKKRV
jgi:transposase-like protein